MSETTCQTCGDPVATDGVREPEEGWLCETCWGAFHSGVSIEEQRAEVEDTAAFWTMRFGRAEGRSCTCGVLDHAFIQEGPRRGRGARRVGVLHFDVRHAVDCPLGPPAFDWPPIDEAARERVFGYRGEPHHVARLVGALREILAEREVMET